MAKSQSVVKIEGDKSRGRSPGVEAMEKLIQVTTSTDTYESAKEIARLVVEKRLAGCVQIIGPITSVYWWEGKIEEAQEWLCVMKSKTTLFGQLKKAIVECHSYDVPEILSTPVSEGAKPYTDWLTGELRDSS